MTNLYLSRIAAAICPGEELPDCLPPMPIDYLADWLELLVSAPKKQK